MNTLVAWYSKHDFKVNLIFSVLAIIVLYHVKYGLGILNPSNFGWLMKWDLATQVMGTNFYRHEPWGFPLGKINNYFYPIGTNIGLTEIPIMTMIVKLLSPVLPENFQYVGLFLFSCHILTAYYSLKLFRLFNIHGALQFLSTMFIVINPVLLYRII